MDLISIQKQETNLIALHESNQLELANLSQLHDKKVEGNSCMTQLCDYVLFVFLAKFNAIKLLKTKTKMNPKFNFDSTDIDQLFQRIYESFLRLPRDSSIISPPSELMELCCEADVHMTRIIKTHFTC